MANILPKNYHLHTVLYLFMVVRNSLIAFSLNTSCGIDKSGMSQIYEGYSHIEYYPWMGYLYYPMPEKRFTTAVALITRQIVIASANEIDKLPKKDFRRKAKIILGGNCTALPFKIKEYSYHPEYRRSSVSEIALIQLDIENDIRELRPICPPPSYFSHAEFYAMSYTNDCTDSRIRIHKMSYVDLMDCNVYYRRQGLNMAGMWPKHSACAKAMDKAPCVWRSGTLLVMRQSGRWLLLGFGVYGPGCSEPARFVDYSMYHTWVQSNILRIGQPAITRVANDLVILRRSQSKVQRFGECDQEEVQYQMYTDLVNTTVSGYRGWYQTATYNLTLIENVEYSCIIFRIRENPQIEIDREKNWPPKLRLRRWCGGPRSTCMDRNYLSIDFFVEIKFIHDILFYVEVYGKEAEVLDPKTMTRASNSWRQRMYPNIVKNWTDFGNLGFQNWLRVGYE